MFALMWILVLSLLGVGCWPVCFWWMHRISSRQDALLKELHGMTERIHQFSKAEHDLIQEVHPKVSEIKEKVQDVADAVAPDKDSANH